MSLTQDLQTLEPGGSLVQLVEVDGTAFGMDKVLRFHAHNINADGWASFAGENLPSIRWQGNEYDPHPYEVTGLALTSTGSQPTPGLSVGNIGNYVTALCLAYDDLVQAKVKSIPHWRNTWMRPTGKQGTPTPTAHRSGYNCSTLTPRWQRPQLRWILNCAPPSTSKTFSSRRARFRRSVSGRCAAGIALVMAVIIRVQNISLRPVSQLMTLPRMCVAAISPTARCGTMTASYLLVVNPALTSRGGKMDETLLCPIRAHVAREYPKEACGLIVQTVSGPLYLPCRNIHPCPTDHFTLAPDDYARAEAQGDIVMIVHSHPDVVRLLPSDLDRLQCDYSGVEWGLCRGRTGIFAPCRLAGNDY